jgi:hypothetical protein
MEIKTLEQYVLAELEYKKAEIERQKIQIELMQDELKNWRDAKQIIRKLLKVKKTYNGDDLFIDFGYVYQQYNTEEFDELVRLFNLESPVDVEQVTIDTVNAEDMKNV